MYANIEGDDIGSVSNEISNRIDKFRESLPKGYQVNFEGEMAIIKESFNSDISEVIWLNLSILSKYKFEFFNSLLILSIFNWISSISFGIFSSSYLNLNDNLLWTFSLELHDQKKTN